PPRAPAGSGRALRDRGRTDVDRLRGSGGAARRLDASAGLMGRSGAASAASRASGASPAQGTVASDMRMAHSSGIGTYLRRVVPRVLGDGVLEGHLLGDPAGIAGLERTGGRAAQVHDCRAPIYSLREQVELARRAPR